jgi:hypothetical protein
LKGHIEFNLVTFVLVLLSCSVVSTLAAVAYGVLVFRGDRRASPGDYWSVKPRNAAASQADRLREGFMREMSRRTILWHTYAAGAWWLAASVFASAASLQSSPQMIAGLIALFLAVFAISIHIAQILFNTRWRVRHEARVKDIGRIEAQARRADGVELSVAQQLEQWSSNPDLRVFVQHSLEGPPATTYQGILVKNVGMGGWGLRAHD